LWSSWLIIGLVFFSFAAFFHNYYLASLTAPLSALVGIGTGIFLSELFRHHKFGMIVPWIFICSTVFLQFSLVSQLSEKPAWLKGALVLFIGCSIIFFLLILLVPKMTALIFVNQIVMIFCLMVIPGYWSLLTVTNKNDVHLPAAYVGKAMLQRIEYTPNTLTYNKPPLPLDDEIVSFLQNNTKQIKYLAAVPDSFLGSNLVLRTNRAVFFLHGFNGKDNIITNTELAEEVKKGNMRYFLLRRVIEPRKEKEYSNSLWVITHCKPVKEYEENNPRENTQILFEQVTLFDCVPK